ncbi:MAG: PAS domain-containing protein [Armatimonadetes bacterium]|nr:PAS domain-containing protein [Armatimonadota bacterium]
MAAVVIGINGGEQAEEELRARERQQAAVAELGQQALAGMDLSALMDRAVALVAGALNVEYVRVLEFLPERKALRLRAGVGWQDGCVGRVTIGIEADWLASCALITGETVIVSDTRAETRFSIPSLLRDHGVISSVTMVIAGREQPYGVLGADTNRERTFTEDEIHFLQEVANVLGTAIERQRAEEALRENYNLLRAIIEASPDDIFVKDLQGRFLMVNAAVARLVGKPVEEILGKNDTAFFPPDAARRIMEDDQRVLASGGSETFEETITGAEGPRAKLTTKAVYHDEQGNVIGLIGIGRDITARKRAEEALRRSHNLLRAVIEGTSDAVFVKDLQGRYLMVNSATARFLGKPAEEIIGKEDAALFPPDVARGIRERDRRILATGQPETFEEVIVGVDGPHTLFTVKTAYHNDQGHVIGIIGIARDITERKRAEAEREQLLAREQATRAEAEAAQRRFAFLAEAGRVLAASLDYATTLENVAHMAVPELADWCVVDVMEENRAIHRVAVAHADPTKEEQARALQRRYPPDPAITSPRADVLRTGKPVLVPEVSDRWLAAVTRGAEHFRLIRELGMRSYMCVPLQSHGRTLGVLTFVSAQLDRRYGPDDLALAEELARDAALAVENARLYRARSEIARTLQESLLPPRLPEIPEVELAAGYRPAYEGVDVGGDFYDVFETSPGAWAMVIGDVAGKGVDAAAVTALARHTLRAVAMRAHRPSQILSQLNDGILQQREGEAFCTVACVCLSLFPFPAAWVPGGGARGARLTLACGGHPLPLLLRADGSVQAIGRLGTLLGFFPDPELADQTVDLHPGDAVILYTDGVTEARAGADLFGEERLASLVAACAGLDARGIVERIEHAVVEFQSGTLHDDIAILVLRIPR